MPTVDARPQTEFTDRPLRVALATTFYPPYNFGGDGIYVRRLAHALVRLGCEVTVIHDVDAYQALAPRDAREPDPLPEPEGLIVERLQSRLGVFSPILTQQTGFPVANQGRIREILARGFDVVHFHNVSLVGGPGMLSMGPDAIRLYTAHEHWLVCPTHILWKNGRDVCDTRACTSCQLRQRRPPQLWRAGDAIRRHGASIDAFIALSQSSADNHRRFGFPFDMRLMPSFLPDAPRRAANADRAKPERPYLLFAGRLEAIKGLQDVIPQFGPDAPADLLIAGTGDHEGELRRLAAGSPAVRFLGRLGPENLDDLYAGALAVLTPSLCLEVFPLVAIEAFRAGAPILARRRGPYPEIVHESGGGLIFSEAGEIPGLVSRLIHEDGLRDTLAGNARNAFEARWSERVSLAAYFGLIAELADGRNSPEMAHGARRLATRVACSETR